MNDKNLPVQAVAIQKLAQKEFTKRKKAEAMIDYKKGSPTEKVWDNYQLTKELKRQFKELCKAKNINASKYLRACVRVLIKKEGDLKKALREVKATEVK
jgi:hypothetical protein